MLSNMRIGPRLISAFMLLVVISAIIGVLGLFSAGRIDDKANDMYEKELLGLSYIKEANIQLISIGRARSNFLLATSQAERDQHLQSIKDEAANALANVEKAKPLFMTDRARELFGQIDKTWAAYDAEMQRALTLAAKEALQTRNQELVRSLDQVNQHAASIDAMMSELTQQKEDRAKLVAQETTEVYLSSRNWIIVALLSGVAIGIALALIISRGVT
ncbi:MAG TPA: MCP four helix bundle domain-containing protein, partial [Povalibacter sp.]|nr:MCP four helix bundle domain-containing protein [Povalibacter sp.]